MYTLIYKNTLLLPSSALAPVQLNWAELAILSLLNIHPPTWDSIKTAGWEAHIEQASLFQTDVLFFLVNGRRPRLIGKWRQL